VTLASCRCSRWLTSRFLLPTAVGLVLLTCYWFTLAPTATEIDSGELCAAVHTMGVAHPTGYPLYLIVGKLFDLPPLGEPARRIAFMSAVSAATAGALICGMVISLTGVGAAGVLGGLAAGLNWWVWPQANQAEVYAFHALLVCLLLAMFMRWLDDYSPRRLNQLAFFSGLALTHHRTSMFFVAPVLLWAVIATRPRSGRLLSRTVVCALLPLLLYLWLPFRAAQHPPLNWGNTSGSLRFFIEHVSGRAYLPLAFGANAASAWTQIQLTLLRLWKQFGAAGLGLALVGMAAMARSPRVRPLGVSLIVGFLAVLVWSASYDVPDRDVFYVPGIIVVAAWCGAGLGEAVRSVRALKLSPRLVRLAGAAATAVALIFALNMGIKNWPLADRSSQYGILESTALSMAGVPSDAVVLLSGELQPSSWYYWYVLSRRPAPLLIPARLAFAPWNQPLLQPEIRAAVIAVRHVNRKSRPVALARAVRERLDPKVPFYTNVELEAAPPGYVLLKDYFLRRVVVPPGVRQAKDTPDSRELIQFPAGGGSLLGVTAPPRATRGKPFAVTAAIRWTGRAQPEGDLRLVFARRDVAARVAKENPQALAGPLQAKRLVPLLFGAGMPASRPRWHYEQTISVLLSRRLDPGVYQVFAQLTCPRERTELAPVGAISVH